MKKLLLLLVIAGMGTTVAIAQETKDAPATKEQKDPKQEKAAWEKKLKDELKLTAEQTVKFDALSKEYSEKIETVLNDATLNDDAKKEKKMALKKEKEAKLFEFLTAEQQTKYKELMEKKKAGAKPAGQ